MPRVGFKTKNQGNLTQIFVILWLMVCVPKALAEVGMEPGKTFRDCPECPEMVVMPAGSFFMGSNVSMSSNESPARKVTIKRPFAMGKTEVTQGEWRALMGNNTMSFAANCGEDCPAHNISWEDAQDYIRKLNQKTGKQYRLPSEAEWEYAAVTREVAADNSCYGSDDPFCAYRDDTILKVMKPVGKGQPNRYGLYDMQGNVWEWVEDCWNDNFASAPTDERAWKSGDCSQRVKRGGTRINNYFSPIIFSNGVSNRDRGEIRNAFKLDGFRIAISWKIKPNVFGEDKKPSSSSPELSKLMAELKAQKKTDNLKVFQKNAQEAEESTPKKKGIDFSKYKVDVPGESTPIKRGIDFSKYKVDVPGESTPKKKGIDFSKYKVDVPGESTPKKKGIDWSKYKVEITEEESTPESPGDQIGILKIIVILCSLLLGYWVFARWFKKKLVSDSTGANSDNHSGDTARQNKPHHEEQRNKNSGEEDNINANWFNILDVPEDASQEQIIEAYKRKIRQYHPDKVAQMGMEIRELAERKSKQINAAYNYAITRRK